MGFILAAASWFSYSEISLWLAPVIVVMSGIVGHMLTASRALPPFRHICVLFAGIQLILMAWLAWYIRPKTRSMT